MLRQILIGASIVVLVYFGVLEGSARLIVWWQKYQAQQDYFAAHGDEHKEHAK